jgi:hypothetical protein
MNLLVGYRFTTNFGSFVTQVLDDCIPYTVLRSGAINLH